MFEENSIKLSICITTFNRAVFIQKALESIIPQLTGECEIVVVDGASRDNTQAVVAECSRGCGGLRYVRLERNNGVERDFNTTVELARGEYCWFMSDDDIIKPGAVSRVLDALHREASLILVNTDVRDGDMSKVLKESLFHDIAVPVYGPSEMDRLFGEMGSYLIYIGCVVIKRSIWLSREKERYYGSMFFHVGVIFQEKLPGEALVITEPCISIRMANDHSYWENVFEIFLAKWPTLIWSLPPSEEAKRKVCRREPWREVRILLLYRALGAYSISDYRRWIRPSLRTMREALPPVFVALVPCILINAVYTLYCSVTRRERWWLPELKKSRARLLNGGPQTVENRTLSL
jgi:abequosyltransferase